MRVQGIRGRLVFILVAAALMVLFASIAALIALRDVNDELDSVVQKELPAITSALGLARIGERLQYQGSVLVSADEADSRAEQQRLIESDMDALVTEIENLRSTSPDGQLIINSINHTALSLNDNLRNLNSYLTTQSNLARELAKQRNVVLQTQEEVKQLLGPSILAVDEIVVQSNAVDSEVYQSAIRVLGPLLSAERLVNNSIEYLLLSITSEHIPTIDQTKEQFQRTRTELDLLIDSLPAGLQSGVVKSLESLEKQLGRSGVFSIRSDELALLAQANLEMTKINMESAQLKSLVDDLVLITNKEIGSVTTRMGDTVIANTLWFVIGSVGAVLMITLFSWYWVIRPVGKNLIGVTTAMTLLAKGKRDVQVPAIERKDEIGDLARAFTVFKNNMTHMDFLDQELSEKSGLLVTTFDNMNDGFTVFDSNHTLIAWNPQFLNLYELSSDFIKAGRSIKDIHSVLGARDFRVMTATGEEKPINQLSEFRDTETLRYEVKCPNGRTLELRSNPVPSGGFVTIHMDTTERLATEAQLRQAQKMEMVGQLTGGIAHDFNNILAVILGNLHVISRGLTDDPNLNERATRALGAADRAARQVERLLAFSRRQRLEPEPVNVNELIADMMDLLGYSLGSKIELLTEFSDDLPQVHVDPGQLENALMNLALNARDALNNEGEILFSTRKLSATFVEVIVKDNGNGMQPEILDHVFEPFFTTKPVGKGSGLGLSMVYGFVFQSGGTIQIASEPSVGTTISLKLPVSQVEEYNPLYATEKSIHLGNGEKILVVDDDKELLEITAEQVLELGYQVYTAEGGEKALKVLQDNPGIQLLYTDVVMPKPWTGLALATEAQRRCPGLKVLFTSAEPSNLTEQGEKVLKKPVSNKQLAKSIADKLSH